jgi:hypothetical protein
MSKPLAGKRWFEALGRSEYSQGLPINYRRSLRARWPMWARSAWARGWLHQQTRKQLTESIVTELLDRAKREGKTVPKLLDDLINEELPS